MAEYQNRYVLYCCAKGLVPGEAFDTWDYISWVKARWREWDAENGHDGVHHTQADHDAFGAWLEAKVATDKESLTVARDKQGV
jgi:hypothetical protein